MKNKKKIKTELQRLVVEDVKKSSSFLIASATLDGEFYSGVLIKKGKVEEKEKDENKTNY